jgi:hypothetical protein
MQELGDQLDAQVVPVTQLDEAHHTVAIQFQLLWRRPWSALRYFSH